MSKIFEYGDKEINHLKKNDEKMGLLIDKIGLIERKINTNLFESLVSSIVGQQISDKAALTVNSRVLELCGSITPEKLHKLSNSQIQACGMSNRKAEYIKNLTEAVINKIVDFDGIEEKSNSEIIKMLTTVKGIGQWTGEMFLIFSLGRKDVISFNDLAIRRGMMRLYGLDELPKSIFNQYTKKYSPYETVAALYLWSLSHRPDLTF